MKTDDERRQAKREANHQWEKKLTPSALLAYRARKAEIGLKWRMQAKVEIDILLGVVCICCNTTENLTIDHKFGATNRGASGEFLRNEIRKRPDDFQRLCESCNRHKGRGPRCPCKWWDQIDPTWRKRAAVLVKGNNWWKKKPKQ